MTPGKKRQAEHRERLHAKGFKQTTLWLTASTLDRLYALAKGSGEHSQAERVNAVINQAFDVLERVTSDKRRLSPVTRRPVTSNRQPVTSDVTRNSLTVTSDNAEIRQRPQRYMSHDLEDKILALRESGLSLSQVAQRLASEGFFASTGRPYATGTLSKAEQRAMARRKLASNNET